MCRCNAELDGLSRQVTLLVDHRRDFVGQRTWVINRLRWHLHELDLALQVAVRGLRSYRVIDDLGEHLATFTGLIARLARELLHRTQQMKRAPAVRGGPAVELASA